MYHYTDGGLRNVWLKNGYTEHKTPYGPGVSFHDLDGLVMAICRALCDKPGKLTGAEFRFIRTTLPYTQKALGKLFGYTEQAVAKWEKYGRVPKVVDAALRLVFIEQHGETRTRAATVDLLHAIERMATTKIIATETQSGWTSAIELIASEQELACA